MANHLLSIIAFFPICLLVISRMVSREMIFGVQRGRAQVFACGPLTGGVGQQVISAVMHTHTHTHTIVGNIIKARNERNVGPFKIK